MNKALLIGLGTCAALAALAYSGLFAGFVGAEEDMTRYAPQTVVGGPFRVTVREKGELDAVNSVVLSNETGESTTIVSLLPAGTMVEEGDLILQLDAVPVEEELQEDQLKVTQARAAFETATQNLEIVLKQNESDVATAALAKTLAALDLSKYEDGEYEQERQKLEGELSVARETLSQAEEDYEFSKRMAKKGYQALNEVETKRIAVNQAQIDVNAAREGLRVLEQYTKPRTLAELRENKTETDRNVERVKAQTKAALAQAQAELEAARLTLEVEEANFARTKRQLDATSIYAPQAGEVVYVSQESRRGEDQSVEKGATVFPRQDLVKLPDLSRIKVNAKIHESQISQINTGLPAIARVDAYPDREFRGVVTAVSSVPVSGSWLRSDLKEYEATVELDPLGPGDPKLKPGLTCELEILVESRSDVLQAPMQSIVSVGGKRFAFVLAPRSPERREVTIGVANETAVEILSGLEAGEQVVMSPRTHFADQLSDLEQRLGAKATGLREEREAAAAETPPEPGNAEAPQSLGVTASEDTETDATETDATETDGATESDRESGNDGATESETP
ncbi:efflux RND transporter periplasmic adaptor subunit [Alienimonas californiensis]|uniref:Macrolide export protein MacA n=1 Tax=Alienimonas californiensis TaxID=2527989 RepID=A0A517P5D5_9PLAN|nr:efflux RND transporter periplasmic adaptor subunit [Alienimonas californiensis]QDT14589.1 Macrolide export protein MacA [Alienimonas californiensis]